MMMTEFSLFSFHFVLECFYRCSMMGTQRLIEFPWHACAYLSSACESKAPSFSSAPGPD